MALDNALLVADVMHARHKPKPNKFIYGVYYLCFNLHEISTLKNTFLSLNRFNVFSLHERDYGKRDGSSPENWIRNVLSEWNIAEAQGPIVLLTLPRVLGHVFNPVSFWFCLDNDQKLRAVLSEVSNTFGEHHSYLSFHEDRRPIENDDWLKSEKIFHVSPFLDVVGHYQFRFAYRENKIGVWIDYYDAEGHMLSTSITGKREPLNARNLLYCFFRYPLVTLKVIGLIHYQAVRLLMKGMRYRAKPLPPAKEISS